MGNEGSEFVEKLSGHACNIAIPKERQTVIRWCNEKQCLPGDMEKCRLGDMPRQARLDDWRGPVVKGRKILCQMGVRKLGYTGASVARFLGMTTSLVNPESAY